MDKNRAHNGMKELAKKIATKTDKGLKLKISGLEGPLAQLTEDEIRKLFSCFK